MLLGAENTTSCWPVVSTPVPARSRPRHVTRDSNVNSAMVSLLVDSSVGSLPPQHPHPSSPVRLGPFRLSSSRTPSAAHGLDKRRAQDRLPHQPAIRGGGGVAPLGDGPDHQALPAANVPADEHPLPARGPSCGAP